MSSLVPHRTKGARFRRHPFFLPSPRRRFASVVPGRIFRSAVKRNYARRRLREFYRRNKSLFPDRTDLVIRLYEAPSDWNRFLDHLEGLLARARGMRDKMERNGIDTSTMRGKP
ncbi:hypothetical protein GF324_02075 [bacterium]|nr:hypothetical protein [bacterium]